MDNLYRTFCWALVQDRQLVPATLRSRILSKPQPGLGGADCTGVGGGKTIIDFKKDQQSTDP